MRECIRHTELPHTTRLFADLVYQFDRVRSFYAHAPFDPGSFGAAAAGVRLEPSHRRALVEALALQNQDGGPAAQEHLDRLARPETLVVASGQQVGLYTGPIFTIYKALSAARLAAQLTARGIPAVPVFWLATEDHDLQEVHHAWVFDAQNRPVRLQALTSPDSRLPVGGVPVGDAARDLLRQALADLPHGPAVARLAERAYGNGATFAAGFRSLLRGLLERQGLLLLDPMAPPIRQLAAPLIRRAILAAPELATELLARGQALHAAGYHVQVHLEDKTSLVFLLEQGRRTALRRSGDTYFANGASHSSAALVARLESMPEDFSPNALLRPVVQDFLLPTVAYIGGPAELAYLAQAEVLYRRLLGRMPVALPRAAFTILDSHAAKLLDRYRLTVLDVLRGEAHLERSIAGSLIPAELETTFRQGQQQIQEALDSVHRQLAHFDPTLAAALGTSRRKIEHQFDKVRAKAGRESLRRQDRARSDAASLLGLILPHKALQERFYSVLPFLARHGLDLIDRLEAAIAFDCPDHQVLVG